MRTKLLASKLDVLEFIAKRRAVSWHDLRDHFRYSYHGAKIRLNRLRKEKLVQRIDTNYWILTEEAYRKLRFYGRR